MATQTLNNSDPSNQAFAEALQRARKIAAKIGEDKGVKRAADDDSSFGAQLAALQQQKATQGKALVSEEYSVPDKMVGLIIGKGGDNIVKIQRETGVLSVQFAQDSGGLSERKCTITGPPSSIEKAKEIINQMLDNAKASIPILGDTEDETVISVGIPADKVGLVIGKGGDSIKKLQEEAGVRMVMIQDGIYATAPEKELRIMGDPERVEKAKELVAELLAQHGYTFDSNEYGSALSGPYLTKEQVIPKCAIGLIIGKNGETIKRIMQESGARIRFKEGDLNQNGDRMLIVAGSQNQIEAAFAAVNSYTQTAQVNSRTFSNRSVVGATGYQQEFHIMVPTNKCGLVIGKGGENIKNIGSMTGAHVELDRRVNTDPSSPEKAFVVRGTHSQLSHAAQLICEKADIPVPPIPAPQPGSNGAALAAYYPGVMQANPYAPQGWTNAYSQWQGQGAGSDPSKQSQDANLAAWAAYYSQYYTQAGQAQAAGSQPGGGAAMAGQMQNQSQNAYYQQSANQQAAGMPQAQYGQAYYPQAAGTQPQQMYPSGQGQTPGQPDYTAAWQAYYQQVALANPTAQGKPNVPSVQN